MKLWLDDVRPMPMGYDVLAKTADEAIEYLKTGQVTEISLDHDLGLDKSGYDVAKWIEEQAAYGQINSMTWHVHSANVVGARLIRKAMEKADEYWKTNSA